MYRRVNSIAGLLLVGILMSGMLTGCQESAKRSHSYRKSAPKTTTESMPGSTKGCMMGKEHMMTCMCPMHHMMMESMMSRSVVATADGVVVMAGDKLMKFDKDLNLVKEVPVAIDTEAVQKKMCSMAENCPMCKSMMHQHSMKRKGFLK